MPKTERALDLWSQEAKDAFWEFRERVYPSWRRKLAAANTPAEPQAKFEEDAIEKEARRLYHQRLLGI